MVLFVVGGVSGILNLPIWIPRNASVLLISYSILNQKYALQMQCILAIIIEGVKKYRGMNMDHSIQAYLRRCSTEKLYIILRDLLNQNDKGLGEDFVLQILDILWSRGENFPECISFDIVVKWEEKHFR